VKVVEDALNGDLWECNGETIIIGWDEEGNARIDDGQNRLWGCVNANKPMKTWICFRRANPKAFMTIDRGKSRNNRDDLGIMQEHNPADLSAALVMLTQYDAGVRSTGLISSPKTDTRILAATLERNPGMRESVRFAVNNRTKIQAPTRIVAFVHYLAGASGNQRVLAKRDEFFDRLVDGVGLGAGSPVLVLRNKLFAMKSNPNVKLSRGMGRKAIYAYLWSMVRCWNAHLMGHVLTKVQMPFKDDAPNQPADIHDVRSYFRKPSEKPGEEDVEVAASIAKAF
jgi:hypothetical protein